MTHSAGGGSRSAISLTEVSKSFRFNGGTLAALSRITLDIAKNEFVSFLGPSGCGKTTLLRAMGELVELDGGSIRIAPDKQWNGTGQEPPASTIVFQHANIFPWLNVRKNIALPLVLARKNKREIDERVDFLLRLTDMDRFASSSPAILSGGMVQRVALARALACEAPILLLDEPFGALDEISREIMNLELQRVLAVVPRTAVLVTHSIAEAVFLSDRVVLLSPRPASIRASYSIPFSRPRNMDLLSTPAFQTLVDDIRRELHSGRETA